MPSEVLRARPERLAKVPYVGKENARAILESKDSTWSLDQISRTEDADVRILTILDPDYPLYLKQIYAPPPVLYMKR